MYTADEMGERLWDTTKNSLLTFALTNAPAAGHNIHVHMRAKIASDGYTKLYAGIMPSDAELRAMGISESEALGALAVFEMEKQDAAADSTIGGQQAEIDVKPVDTGELRVVETKPPKTANDEWMSKGYDQAPYDSAYEVKVVRAGNEKYVRVFAYNEDGTSNKLGYWLMRASDIEGLTAEEIADKYSLPRVPTHICDVIIDPDIVLQAGIANPVEGWGNGGGLQFDTMGKRLPRTAFMNERLIGE